MSDAVQGLLPTLLALPEEDRELLANTLLDSVHGGLDEDPELLAMLNQRLDDMTSGRVKPVPIEEMMKRMREKYG